jgi:hypothetical protein
MIHTYEPDSARTDMGKANKYHFTFNSTGDAAQKGAFDLALNFNYSIQTVKLL